MPAAKPAPAVDIAAASSRRTVAEIYRSEDWRALTRHVDLCFEALKNREDEISDLRDRLAALEAQATF